MASILSVGDYTVDDLLGPFEALPAWGQEVEYDTHERRVGGNAGNFALALSRLGASVRCVGPVGGDADGHWLRDRLEAAGCDCSGLAGHPGAQTSLTTALIRSDGERMFLTRSGALQFLPAMLAAPERGLMAGADCALFTGWCQPPRVPSAVLLPLFASLREAGTRLAFDLSWSDASWTERDAVLEGLKAVDVALMNRDELCALSGIADLDTAFSWLSQQLGPDCIIAIKLGPDGALIRPAGGGAASRIPAVARSGAAVGTGDAFNAGFIFALSALGADAQAAGRFAVTFAGAVLAAGGIEAVPAAGGDSPFVQAMLQEIQ